MINKNQLKIEQSISPHYETECPIDINAAVGDEGLHFTFAFNKKEFNTTDIETFANSYKANLKTVIDHCIEKKKEILDLGMSSLQYHIHKEQNKYLTKIQEEKIPILSQRHNYKHILVTGSTGYLGAYIVNELLNETDAILYLPVRAKEGEEIKRIEKHLNYYFGDGFYYNHHQRLEVFRANLNRETEFFTLGADCEKKYYDYADKIEAIIHSAALVKHFGDYKELEDSNVEGTRRLLDFALTGRKKVFHFISTLDTGRADIPGKDYALFTEYTAALGQKSENVYIKSKSIAEDLVVEYRNKGLKTFIHRAGNMTFHSKTGKFQENIGDNFTYSMLKTLINVGFWSEKMRDMQWDYSFVDLAARAIVILFLNSQLEDGIYHIRNPELLSWREMAKLLNENGEDVADLKVDATPDHLKKFEGQSENEKLIERVKLYSYIWEGAGNTKTVTLVNRTQTLLKALNFQWPKVERKHIEIMIAHCREVGFLSKK